VRVLESTVQKQGRSWAEGKWGRPIHRPGSEEAAGQLGPEEENEADKKRVKNQVDQTEQPARSKAGRTCGVPGGEQRRVLGWGRKLNCHLGLSIF
jgi:hypothetical protein